MRIARIEREGRIAHAVVEGESARTVAGDIFGSWTVSGSPVPLADVRLLAPVVPPQIVAVGLNYSGHAEESGMALPDAPVLFVKTANTVVGPQAPIVLPAMAPNEVDYEAELVLVVGRQARNVSTAAAGDYILGYTCGNDVSARDCQLRLDKQWARGKCFDSFAPLGPWIETGIDGDDLEIRLTLDETLMQQSRTSDMIFPCRELLSYVSQCMTLYPGSVIMTGTPAGVGFSRKPPVFLREGSRVCIEIEGIGKLENPVIQERVR